MKHRHHLVPAILAVTAGLTLGGGGAPVHAGVIAGLFIAMAYVAGLAARPNPFN